MDTITINNFSGGWSPSSDPVNGPKNVLLKMDNVDLDTNGALSLIGGTSIKQTGFPSNAHTMYSRYINGARHDYSALSDGSVYRDGTSIITGGNTVNAGFGTAFNFTLISSGNLRKKDIGSGVPVNLGLIAPTVAPTVTQSFLNAPFVIVGSVISNIVTPVGASAVIAATYLQMTATAGTCVVQTFGGTADPHNLNVLAGVGNTGYGTDDDVVSISGYTPSPIGEKFKFDILLSAGNGAGDPVADYYTFEIDLGDTEFDPVSGVFTLRIKRSQFTKVGNGTAYWSSAYGFRMTYTAPAGSVINILGSYSGANTVYMMGGTKAQRGTYQYAQVNVNNTGSYLAKSVLGVISNPITIQNNQGLITPRDPTADDTQCNEAWIYRRSVPGTNGNLAKWYRVLVFTGSFGTPVYDTFSDLDALTLNEYVNENLISIASSSISDRIIDIVGPIEGRWFYFTINKMYPSDINNPDLVDSTRAVRTTGSDSEIFLWARKVSEAVVLVGTSIDIYILTGTFQTLPDGVIDIYYRAMGVKYPPLTYDADVWGGNIFYLANDGWRSININGENPLNIAPHLDKLYRGIVSNGYTAPNLKILPGSQRFPVVVARNKLWCFVYGTNRCEVYDFLRQYWRNINYNLGDATAACSTQDGQILAFYGTDKKTREIDISTSKLIDGSSSQTVTMQFMRQDNNTPKQRKDSYTIKARLYTGLTGSIDATIVDENNVSTTILSAFQSTLYTLDKYKDLSQIAALAIVKTYHLTLSGTVSDLLLTDIVINFDTRPIQVTFIRLLNDNFGTASRKRIRVRPLIIDTLGNTVVYTPTVDNATLPTTNISTSNKDTVRTYFTTDVFGVDYGGTLYCANGLFEYWGALPPDAVQVLPIARRFDQVGPIELFKFGKLKQLEYRVLPVGGSSIPYQIFFNDGSVINSTLSVTDTIDKTYFIDLPKGTSGNVLRIEFGPTNFDFHRMGVRVQCARSGRDTELEWVDLSE